MAERRGGNLAPIPKVIKDAVRAKYMEGLTPAEIEAESGVAANTIYAWVRREGWKDERQALKLQMEQDANFVRANQINHILFKSYSAIMELVDGFKKMPLTLDDALKVTRMMSELNKIKLVNEGRPTDVKGEHRVVEHREVSTESEMRDVLEADPFTDNE